MRAHATTAIWLAAWLAAGPAAAETYHVAPGGDDGGPGTESEPWETIQRAADTMVAGDTVLIHEGTYAEHVTPASSGAPGAMIVYAAAEGETAVIDGTGVTVPDWGGLFQISRRSHIEVAGLRVQHSSNVGIFVDRANTITIRSNVTYDTFSSGIGVWSSQGVDVIGNEVELACNDGSQECITIGVTTDFTVGGNHVHHSGPGTIGGEGIDIKAGSSRGMVFLNHVHHIERLGIYVDSWDAHQFDIEVFSNVVHDCSANGYALAAEAGGLLENVRVYNNVAWGNASVGLTVARWGDPGLAHPMQDLFIVNNTLVGNGVSGWGGGIFVENHEAVNVVIRNNLVSQNASFQIRAAEPVPLEELVVDHNLVDGFRGATGELRGTDAVEGDPLFADPASNDYHLLEGSPAIDAGSSVQAPEIDFDYAARPAGEAHDIGAFEWSAGAEDEAEVIETVPDAPADASSEDPVPDDGEPGRGCGCTIAA